jgi:predicted DCC family thiol-disulfide oxidoreductase YuxK
MRGFPGFLKFLTFVTIWTEMFLPYLMLIPIFSKRLIYFRYIPILFFVFFHMGIDFLMNVGIFPYYAMAIWIGLMPGHFWDYLTQKFHTEKRKNLTIYYDGDCGFCRKLVYIIKEFFLISKTKVYPSILNPNIDNVLKTQNTWVVKDETNQLHTKFDGIITVIQYSPIISWLSPLFTTKFIKNLGDYLYTFVANNRKFFSKFTTFLSFKKHQQIDSKSNLFLDALALLWIMCLLHWPMADLKIKPWYGLNWTWQTNRYLNSYQHWGLFSPYPKRNNVWIQIIGNLSDKTKVNLARFNFEVNDNWPKRLNTLYYNKMWRKFILRLEKSSKYRTYISKYHCKNWNYRHVRLNKHLLKSVDIIMHDELNYLNYRRGKRRRRLLQREVCY